MSKFNRYRLPPWAMKCVFLLEKAIIPIIIFQSIRTLIFLTTLDVFLLVLMIGLFIAFYLDML